MTRLFKPLMIALAIGSSLLLTACGSGQDAEPSDPDAVVLHRGNGAEPASLDPHQGFGTWSANVMGDMFMGLMTEDPMAEIVYGAAESHTRSEDGLTYTFALRDHTWSDGTPVTADDFVFAFRRILNPETGAVYASLLYILKNGKAINQGEAEPETLGARAIDDKTLELTLEHPAPYLLELTAHATFYPLPKHVVEEHGDDWIKPQNAVANGAYTLVEWAPNDYVHLRKNEKFWDAANVAVDEVYFYPTTDAAAALRRFQSGELDTNTTFPAQRWPDLRENMPDEAFIHPTLSSVYVIFNHSKPPFDDARVRRAFSLAADRETISYKIMNAGQTPAYAFVPPAVRNYLPEEDRPYLSFKDLSPEERIAEAKRLMEEAGYGPGNPLRTTMNTFQTQDALNMSIALQNMWKEIHADVQLLDQEAKTHYSNLRGGDFEVAFAAWKADYADAQNFLFLFDSKSGELNYGRYKNPEYDALLQQAENEADLLRRAEILAAAETIALEDTAVLPIYVGAWRLLIGKHVVGFKPNAPNWQRTRWVSIDESKRD